LHSQEEPGGDRGEKRAASVIKPAESLAEADGGSDETIARIYETIAGDFIALEAREHRLLEGSAEAAPQPEQA